MPERLLLVEDRENLRKLLARTLGERFEVDDVADAESALQRLRSGCYALVITDVRLPGADGTVVLAAARAIDPPPEVVLMTAYAELPAAVQALRAGAYDYVAKPFEPDDLLRIAVRAAERHALLGRTRELEAMVAGQESAFVGRSPAAVEVRRWIERVGRVPAPVLLLGESGSGKEVAAREIHRVHGKGEFVALNCGAIPENLLEAELFGVARGAYTGAAADRPGLLEAAKGGTLLLDEIGDMPLPLQVKLNRVLDEGSVRRVGETGSRPFEARVVAATHRDLEKMVASGAFRQDLYFRLKVVQVFLPPLRQRVEDISLLATLFLKMAGARYGTRARRLAPEALAALEAAPWPGNVRELRHALEHAAVIAPDETVELYHLPESIRGVVPQAPAGSFRAVCERASDAAGHDYLLQLLRRTSGNVTHAAAEAGMERESMHRLLKRHGIDPARFRAP
ncbi:MAG: sigma-54 dependent transcriptional regulator [Pseudomonadota bacterium]|nr:sigma-54 dependent transcriptional regulator [Pseudomonadota bacterium]